MLLLLTLLTADLSGTWVVTSVGTVKDAPMCLALSQTEAAVSGNLAYENDTKYAAISIGKLDGENLQLEVADLARGTLHFNFHLTGEKLIGDDGTELTRWLPRRNSQFDAGLPLPPSVLHRTRPVVSEKARQEPGFGTVKLSILILTNGDVDRRTIKVVASAGKELDEAAIQAVLKWKFTPPREDCGFYEKRTTLEFNMRGF